MIYLAAVAALLVATVVGVNFGWRWVLAPVLGWVLLRWLLGSLRALVADSSHAPEAFDAIDARAADGRTIFWCEECGTEVLALRRGSPRAPSHCGQRMHERTELGD
ncbi:MAG: hypothetical protein WD011_02480 [Nitriliruptoraceae bacterium]